MSTADLVRAALEGRPPERQTEPASGGGTVALNDNDALKAIICAALGASATTNNNL